MVRTTRPRSTSPRSPCSSRPLPDYPGNPFLLYNIACCESLLGRKDEALGHLELAVAAHGLFLETARDDRDLDPVRDDPRFEALFA